MRHGKWATIGACVFIGIAGSGAGKAAPPDHDTGGVTPIQHVVVIFQENVSFDHYFATYPNAANPPGEPEFVPAKDTPTVNGLNESLTAPNNPNSVQPFRLDRSQFQTCDQSHSYRNEQRAVDGGLMDRFVETVGRGAGTCQDYGHGPGLVMGYYDGNTVTALWNYAQTFAMNDNSYDTVFGPSSPGAINLISGQTHGFATTSTAVTPAMTMVGDPQPAGDICDTRDTTTSIDPNNLPAVSFLKAPAYQDGHASNSDPLDEQEFIVTTINRLERTPFWHNTAVIILYDDSDGWYDHVMSPIVNHSMDPTMDAINGTSCGLRPEKVAGGYQDRCGYGPRQPLLVISPYARTNFVDHTITDQTSVLRFIEDNWETGRIGNFSFDERAGSIENMFRFAPAGPVGGENKLFLDPVTGMKNGR